MFSKILKFSLSAFVLSALTFSTAFAKKDTVQTIDLNTTAGEMVHINVNKNGFLFDKYKGKTVLLDLFGPMCPHCLLEIPHLIEMQKEHKDKLQIIGVQVQMQMTDDELKAFMKEKGINYPVVNLNNAWDLVSFIRANTGWGGQIPYMLVFDKTGDLKKQFIGMVPNKKILKYVK